MDKVIDIEERIPTLRERRKKRTNRKFVALLSIFLLLLAFAIYSQTKYSKIQDVAVAGANLYAPVDYQLASGLEFGDSMWSFSEQEIEEKLNGLEWVKASRVEKKWLTGVEIYIAEHEKIGYLDNGAGYQMVLSNGYALEKPITSVNGPIFINFENEEARQTLAAQLAEIDSEVYNLISQVTLDPEKNSPLVSLYMNDGNEVKGTLSTLAEKLNYYPSVIAQLEKGQKGIIDMEVGIFFQSYDDVYGPPKEGEEDQESEEE
jgi:cell division protein FtsQ